MKGDKLMKTLIIIPAYNEGLNIKRVVDDLRDNYSQFDFVIINDGSKDDTANICREQGYNLIDFPVNLGLTSAVQCGMMYANKNDYDYAIQFDADGQHKPEYLQTLLNVADKKKCDIVIGSRFVTRKKPLSLRMMGNNIISNIIYLTTKKRINDPTSGMRLYDKRAIQEFATNINYGPEPDTLAFLISNKMRCEEVQIEMDERVAGESYLNLKHSMMYMSKMVISILVIQWFRKREAIK